MASLKTAGRSAEIWGGLAAMLVALPSAIAFGLVIYSVLGPEYAAQGAMAGILGTIAIGIVAPIFGGTPRLISGPCAPAAAVMAALAADLSGRGSSGSLPPDRVVWLLMLTAALAGVLQLVFGKLRGGRVIKYIPYPVVAGYLGGVGALIFLSQLPRLFGLSRGTSVWAGLAAPSSWRGPALVVGITTMLVMTLAPRVTRAVPAPILGLAGGLLAYLGLSAMDPALRTLAANSLVIGPIGGEGESTVAAMVGRWTSIARLDAGDLFLVLTPALMLAVLLSIDTLKTCIVVDALTRSRHDSNRELRGQGLGNLTSALAGGIPGAGQMGATLVNLSSGGRTRASSILEGVFALGAFLLFGGLAAWIPISALAGILIVVAFRMVDPNIVQLLRQRSTILDFVVVAAVAVTAVSINLIAAAGIGLGLATLLFVREQIRGSVVRRKTYGNQNFSKRRRLPEEIAILEKQGDETVICELQGALFFGTTDQLLSELEPDLRIRTWVILDMRRVQLVDFTATHMLEQMEVQLAERGAGLIFSELPPSLPTGQDLGTYFDQMGLVRPSRHVRIFDELDDALEWTENEILAREQMFRVGHETLLELGEIDLLKGLDADALSALAACAAEASFGAGQRIFREGATGDELYLIRRGVVRILLPLAEGKQHHLATFARGDFFGDMAFLDGAARSADAVASTPADLYVLPRARFDAVAAEHPGVAERVFARLARALAIRLRQTDAELRTLKES